MWKTRSVENVECGKRGVWKMRSVENKSLQNGKLNNDSLNNDKFIDQTHTANWFEITNHIHSTSYF